MSERDRPGRDRGAESDPRRDPRDVDRTARRPRQASFDDEAEDLPTWSGSSGRGAPREDRQSGTRGSAPTRDSSGRREPIPQLGDAFRRPARGAALDPEDNSPASTRDPYDRLRRVAAKPQRPVRFEEDDELDSGYGVDYDEEGYEPAARPRPRRRASGPPPDRTYRPPASQQLGSIIASAAPQTRFLATVAGLSLLSLVFMIATVAGRQGSMADWMPIHLNAEGSPDRWGSPDTVWRIPLMVFMLTVMSGVVAWFAGKHDAFAARFAVGSVVLVHALAWIAVVGLAW